jgi:DNA-binding CsgD family transcriptional regulator
VEEHIEAEHEASRRTALTAAERKIAALVAEGLTNTQIGVQLGLAEKTVETHLSHVFRKLGIRSREELR